MADGFERWKEMTLQERIQRRYQVDKNTAHLIAQKYLNLALLGLVPGTTIRKAYTGEERERLLDQAAETVAAGLQQQT